MEDANGADLVAVPPLVRAGRHAARARDAAATSPAPRRARLTLAQTVPPTPGQPDKQPMPIPLRLALFGAASGAPIGDERVHVLDDAEREIVFEGVDERAGPVDQSRLLGAGDRRDRSHRRRSRLPLGA